MDSKKRPRGLYDDLGVSPDATQDEINAAYKKAAKENHPDVHKGDPAKAERFKKITSAALVLRNPDKRKRYDEGGENTTLDDPIERGAYQIIHGMLDAVLESPDSIDTSDLIKVIEKSIVDIIKKVNEDLKKPRRKARRATKLKKRFTRKGGNGSSIIGRMLESQEEKFLEEVKKLEEVLAQARRAIEIVLTHEFERDNPFDIFADSSISMYPPTHAITSGTTSGATPHKKVDV